MDRYLFITNKSYKKSEELRGISVLGTWFCAVLYRENNVCDFLHANNIQRLSKIL